MFCVVVADEAPHLNPPNEADDLAPFVPIVANPAAAQLRAGNPQPGQSGQLLLCVLFTQ